MSAPSRLAPRACLFCRAASPTLRRTFTSATATTTITSSGDKPPAVWPQRQPRGEYYDILLRDPTPYTSYKIERPPSSASAQPTSATTTAKENPSSTTKAAFSTAKTPTSSSTPARTYETIASRTAYSGGTDTTTAEERARVIFGSRLLGPSERAKREAGRTAQSSSIAGVLVPPRPEEPDSCCMSGCVNCVWDLYREEMEEWTAKSNEAKKRLAEEAAASAVAGSSGSSKGLPAAAVDRSASMDATSGGAVGETKIATDMWTDDLFQNVPVGIREFMKQEKRLKEKHQREGTSGG